MTLARFIVVFGLAACEQGAARRTAGSSVSGHDDAGPRVDAGAVREGADAGESDDGGAPDGGTDLPSFLGWFASPFSHGTDAGADAGVRLPPECIVGNDGLVPVDPEGVVVAAGATSRDEGFGFAVAFAVTSGVDTFVRFRVFDECGAPIGGDVEVDATGRAVSGPVAAPLHEGGFSIAWSREDAPGDGAGAGVLFHRYDLDGDGLGATTLANEGTFDDQLATSAAGLPDGFALAWEDNAGGVLERPSPVMATFDGDGDPISGDLMMDSAGDEDEYLPVLGAAPDGSLLATWGEQGMNILARRRSALGAWVEDPFFLVLDPMAVATGVAGSEYGYAAAVTLYETDPFGDVDLVLVPAEGWDLVQVEVAHEQGNQSDEYDPLVAPLEGGGWFVAWTDRTHLDAADESGTTVRAQRFDSEGVATDLAPFVVPTTTDFDQDLVALAPGAGGILVVWLDASGADLDRDGGLRARLIPYDFEAP